MEDLESKLEQKNQEQDKKIDNAIKTITDVANEMKNDANQKILEMMRIVENFRELNAERITPRSSPQQPTQAQITVRVVPSRPAMPKPLFKLQNNDIGDAPKKNVIPKMKSKFYNSLHERKVAFKHALELVGLSVTREELLAWIVDPLKIHYTDLKLIRDQTLDGLR